MAIRSTPIHILDTAERLFGEHGIGATSLRSVVAAAGVNVAAVHYHFGPKEELVRRVFERRVAPLNAERLRLLDAAEARGARARDYLERVLEALVAPPLRLSRDRSHGGKQFMKLVGRTFGEADTRVRQTFYGMFEEVVRRFVPAIARACPHLPRAALFWRCHFMIGGMAHAMCAADAVEMYASQDCDTEDIEEVIRQLVAFGAAGLRAADAAGKAARRRSAGGRRP